jgi:hypothetical protein
MTHRDIPEIKSVAILIAESCRQEFQQFVVYESEFSVEIVGRVETYYLKQLAQETILKAVGERQLINRIAVHPMDD